MKRLIILTAAAAALLAACNSGPNERNQVSIQSSMTGTGFDVNKLAAVVKKSTNPQLLEQEINTPSNGITNLDLNNDGTIDYLKVVEKENNRLNVVDDVDTANSVNVATINITPNQQNQTAVLNVDANPDYAGNNYYYHSSFSLGDVLLMSYLLRPHPYYYPIYHYGYYPHYYTRTRVITSRPNGFASRSNPVYRSTPAYRRSLSSPSSSQRSFSSRSGSNGSRRSTAFGSSNRSSGSSFGSSSGSSRRSFGSSSGSSRRSFGGSRSGFGRRH